MKRVKVMLTAIAVLAVVGGALAFKAQKFSLRKICYGTTTEAALCQTFAETSTITNVGSESFYYTQVPNSATNCANVISCPTQTYLKHE